MFLINQTELYQELRKNFALPPASSPLDVFEKLAEKRRNKVSTTTKLKVHLLEQIEKAELVSKCV